MKFKLLQIISLFLLLAITIIYYSCSVNNPFSAIEIEAPKKPIPNTSNSNEEQNGVNHSPIISSFVANPSIIHVGQNANLETSASDEDGDPLSYNYSFIAGSGNITGTGNKVSATINSLGSNIIKVSVTDGKGGEATKTADLTSENQSPNISGFTSDDSILIINNSTILQCTADDFDSDYIYYDYEIISGGGTITGTNATVTYKAPNSANTNRIKVTVSDQFGGKTSLTLDIVSMLFAAPTGVSASDGTYGNKVRISWNSTGAEKYYIYRSTSTGGIYNEIINTTSTYIDDTTASLGVTYYYKIKSYTALNGYSDFSSYDSGYRVLLPPSSVLASWGTYSDKIRLTWSSVSEAEKYYIYRSTSSGGVYVEIGNTTGNTFDDITGSYGVIYYYKIKSYENGYGFSSYSSYTSGLSYENYIFNSLWNCGSSSGLQITGDNNYLYVSIFNGCCIKKYNFTGMLIDTWNCTDWDHPYAIAIDHNNYIYVGVDNLTEYEIRKYDTSGNFITKWNIPGRAYGLATDSFNNLYSACYTRIIKYSDAGIYITEWGSMGTGNGQFGDFMLNISIDNNDYVYVTDTANSRVQKFMSDGTFLTKWGNYGSGDGQFKGALNIGVDNNDYIYISDAYLGRVQKFDSTGNFICKFGSEGSQDFQFNNIECIYVDVNNYIYVGDIVIGDDAVIKKWEKGN